METVGIIDEKRRIMDVVSLAEFTQKHERGEGSTGRPRAMVRHNSDEFFDPEIATSCDHYRMVGVDLPGYGKSSKSADDYGYDAHSRDLKHLMGELELGDATLIGWSMEAV